MDKNNSHVQTRSTGNTEHYQINTGESAKESSKVEYTTEDLLQKYLVSSMTEVSTKYFSPVTDLLTSMFKAEFIQNDYTNTSQSLLFNSTRNSGQHIEVNFHKFFMNAMSNVKQAISSENDGVCLENIKNYEMICLKNPSVITKCVATPNSNQSVRNNGAAGQLAQLKATNDLEPNTPIENEIIQGHYSKLIGSENITDKNKENLDKKYQNRNDNKKYRCCICGLGEPPELIDIEHVVSSQLLLWLGINPGIYSAQEFGINDTFADADDDIISVASDLAFPQEMKKESKFSGWAQKISQNINGPKAFSQNKFFNEVYRSMFLPAHAHCNRTIKSEYSPFKINQDGKIISDLTMELYEKNGKPNPTKSYETNVIEKSIDRIILKMKNDENMNIAKEAIEAHKKSWIEIQKSEFDNIAGLLDQIDKITKEASYSMLEEMLDQITKNENIIELNSFRDFIYGLIGYPTKPLEMSNEIDVLNLIKDNKTELCGILALINRTMLQRFIFCVHKKGMKLKEVVSPNGTNSTFIPSVQSTAEKSETNIEFTQESAHKQIPFSYHIWSENRSKNKNTNITGAIEGENEVFNGKSHPRKKIGLQKENNNNKGGRKTRKRKNKKRKTKKRINKNRKTIRRKNMTRKK